MYSYTARSVSWTMALVATQAVCSAQTCRCLASGSTNQPFYADSHVIVSGQVIVTPQLNGTCFRDDCPDPHHCEIKFAANWTVTYADPVPPKGGVHIYDNMFMTYDWQMDPGPGSGGGVSYYSIGSVIAVPCGHIYSGRIYVNYSGAQIEVGGGDLICGGCGT